jgi:hypothetical protein
VFHPISLPVHISRPSLSMCLFPDSQRACRCRLLRFLLAGRFSLRSLALALAFLVYPLRPSRTLCAARAGRPPPSPPRALPTLPF